MEPPIDSYKSLAVPGAWRVDIQVCDVAAAVRVRPQQHGWLVVVLGSSRRYGYYSCKHSFECIYYIYIFIYRDLQI